MTQWEGEKEMLQKAMDRKFMRLFFYFAGLIVSVIITSAVTYSLLNGKSNHKWKTYDYFTDRKEIFADIDGDGGAERIYVEDIWNGESSVTRISAEFENGDYSFVEFPGKYASWFVAGDLNNDGITDIALTRAMISSNYGAAQVNLLRFEGGQWVDYSSTLSMLDDMERETMVPFVFAEGYYLGATIVEGEKQHMLRLVVPDDIDDDEKGKCIDLSYQNGDWKIEHIQTIEDYYSNDKNILNFFGR